MRLALLCAFLGAVCTLAPMSALAQTRPRYHNASGSSGVSAPRYSAPRYSAPVVYPPLWEFRYYPRGIPKGYDAKKPGYRYYPYFRYRSSLPQGKYDRNKSQAYPVR